MILVTQIKSSSPRLVGWLANHRSVTDSCFIKELEGKCGFAAFPLQLQ